MASPKKSGTGLWFDSFTLVGASRSSPLGLFVLFLFDFLTSQTGVITSYFATFPWSGYVFL